MINPRDYERDDAGDLRYVGRPDNWYAYDDAADRDETPTLVLTDEEIEAARQRVREIIAEAKRNQE